ncbi:MAG: FAD-dependent oxidoreductase [Oligoflexia bacterium]|nr:FAD-dependent oxidoreductase [Oligoflexia bacterium]
MDEQYSCVIIGAGPAGLSVAIAITKNSKKKVLVLDREKHPGGILNQCIHTGFGLTQYKEELTGPEYAWRVYSEAKELGIEIRLSTSVIRVSEDKVITTISAEKGIEKIKAQAIVFCTGCRERARGVIHIPGDRPAGVYTAGLAQKFINIDGYLPGKRVVILGSGDIGLIMARRLTFQGAKVLAVLEASSFVGGLSRNVVQCLDDFGIPLYLSHTIIDIVGKNRVEKVKIARVDENMRAIRGTEFEINCDTVLLSIGLIPENELAEMAQVKLDPATNGAIVDENYMTNISGIFSCGNALHVHDLVDKLAVEAQTVGKKVAEYISGGVFAESDIIVTHDDFIRYLLPKKISGKSDVRFHFRVRRPLSDVVLKLNNFERKFPYLQPNEMSSVLIPAKHFEDIEEGIQREIKIWIREN